MGVIRKTFIFVLTPIFVVMLGAAFWYHFYEYGRAEQAAQRQLSSAAELASQLILRQVTQIDQALDSVIVQGHLQQYHMYSQVGLLDEAEDSRLWVEQALERLAKSNPDVNRIECYTTGGARFIAVIDGRRVLTPASVSKEPWFSVALKEGESLEFSSAGLLRLAEARKPEYARSPIAVVAIEFDFRDAAAEATEFATRHLTDVVVSIVDNDQTVHFLRGSLSNGDQVLQQEAPLDRFNSTLHVQQTKASAMSEFYRARNVLYAALSIVTVGLLGVATVGTHKVVRDLREANQRIDQANRDLSRHAEDLEKAHHALEEQTAALQSEQELLKQLFAVQERDRQLTAYEIHDGLVQYAAGALMLLEACDGFSHDKTFSKNMETAATQMRKIIVEGRRLMNGLRPPVLDESGVVEAIRQLLADEEARAGLVVAFDHNVEFDRLDSRLEGAIFRIVQEALNNVRRHGHTDHAAVRMTEQNGSLEIVVRDQGVGFNPDTVRLESFGLRGIRERARVFGGTATIVSAPGEGTLVQVTMPTQTSI